MSNTRKALDPVEAAAASYLGNEKILDQDLVDSPNPTPRPKLNPFSLARPKPRTVTLQLVDDDDNNLVMDITLRSLDQAEAIRCAEIGELFIQKYLGDEHTRPQMTFPLVGGQRVQLSRLLIQTGVVLSKMQVSSNPDLLYTVEDFIALSVTAPNLYQKLGTEMAKLMRKDDGPKNDSLMADTEAW